MTALAIRQAPFTPEAFDALAVCLRPELDTTGGLWSLAELCNGGRLFEVADEAGKVVLRYVLHFENHANGRECVVMAAVGAAPGVNLTQAILPLIEAQAQREECKAVTFYTRHRGLVVKAGRMGYSGHGVILRKGVA